jgi:LDH2 family malate/lactate/ureidoglycolate dehydrogenase
MRAGGMAAAVERVLVQPDALKSHCVGLLARLGVAAEDAEVTADVFCQAELMGEESHGLRLFLHVLGRLRAGGDRAETRIATVTERGALALWDGGRSVGQVVAARAMRHAINLARRHGLGFVAARNANSFTSAKYYALIAADAGMIGCAFTNTSRKLMPPPGGRTPVIGNNPVAYAAPAGRHGRFVLDMACTAAAVERIVQARDERRPIPPGWALDADGKETTDPQRALDSLALLPFGGHKAFGLAMVHELLTSVLAGGPLMAGEATGFLPYDQPMNTAFSMLAIDISAFQPVAGFEQRMEAMIAAVKASGPRSPDAAILYPGERALAERARRLAEGIPLVRSTFDGLNDWAHSLAAPALAAKAGRVARQSRSG